MEVRFGGLTTGLAKSLQTDLQTNHAIRPATAHRQSGFSHVDQLASDTLSKKEISGGVVHDLPADLKRALTSDAKALETWGTLRLSRAMNGSAGSSRQKGRKQELTGSNGAVPASKAESGDPVGGLAVRIVNRKAH